MRFLEKDFQIIMFISFEHNQFGKSNHWLNSLLISNNEDNKEFKRLLYSQLSKENILIRAGWKPINQLKMYVKNPSDDCSIASNIAARIINLPSNFLIR